MMHWEKKIPNSKGLWANSSDGKTLRSVYIFREDSCWNSDCYWCRIGDIPEISPPKKQLTYEDLVKCMQNGKDVTFKDKDSGGMHTAKIYSLQLFSDKSYIVKTRNGRECTETEYSFYGDV